MKSYFRFIVLALVVLTANALSVANKVDNDKVDNENTDVESRKHHFFAPALRKYRKNPSQWIYKNNNAPTIIQTRLPKAFFSL